MIQLNSFVFFFSKLFTVHVVGSKRRFSLRFAHILKIEMTKFYLEPSWHRLAIHITYFFDIGWSIGHCRGPKEHYYVLLYFWHQQILDSFRRVPWKSEIRLRKTSSVNFCKIQERWCWFKLNHFFNNVLKHSPGRWSLEEEYEMVFA